MLRQTQSPMFSCMFCSPIQQCRVERSLASGSSLVHLKNLDSHSLAEGSPIHRIAAERLLRPVYSRAKIQRLARRRFDDEFS